MKSKIIAYQIITVLLMPFAFLLGISAISLIGQAFTGAFQALLPLFIFGSVVIYIFLSNRFLKRVLILQGTLKAKTKDWIKVNGFVTLFMAGILLMLSIGCLTQPESFQLFGDQMYDNIAQVNANITRAEVDQSIRTLFYIFIAIAVLLISHFVLTFKFLKQLAHHFVEKDF